MKNRIFFLVICILFAGFMYGIENKQVYVRYTAYPQLISGDQLRWVVENRDSTNTMRCEDYGFLQGVIKPAARPGKQIRIQTACKTVEIAPGERVQETIPLDLEPGDYQFVLHITGDHGVNGTYRVARKIN